MAILDKNKEAIRLPFVLVVIAFLIFFTAIAAYGIVKNFDISNALAVIIEIAVAIFITIVVWLYDRREKLRAGILLKEIKNQSVNVEIVVKKELSAYREKQSEFMMSAILSKIKELYANALLIVVNTRLNLSSKSELEKNNAENLVNLYKSKYDRSLEDFHIMLVISVPVVETAVFSSLNSMYVEVRNKIEPILYVKQDDWNGRINTIENHVRTIFPHAIEELVSTKEKILNSETVHSK